MAKIISKPDGKLYIVVCERRETVDATNENILNAVILSIFLIYLLAKSIWKLCTNKKSTKKPSRVTTYMA